LSFHLVGQKPTSGVAWGRGVSSENLIDGGYGRCGCAGRAEPIGAPAAGVRRTAPLWGVRTRNRLMHDGLTFTLDEAVRRHRGQALGVGTAYTRLTGRSRNQVLAFLNSL